MASVVDRDQTTTATCVARSEPPLTGIAHEALSGAAVKLAVLRDKVAHLFGWLPEAAMVLHCMQPLELPGFSGHLSGEADVPPRTRWD